MKRIKALSKAIQSFLFHPSGSILDEMVEMENSMHQFQFERDRIHEMYLDQLKENVYLRRELREYLLKKVVAEHIANGRRNP